MAQQKPKSQARMKLNMAKKEELMRAGIDESIAQKVIDYRNQNGPFRSWQDLGNIQGLGSDVMRTLKQRTEI